MVNNARWKCVRLLIPLFVKPFWNQKLYRSSQVGETDRMVYSKWPEKNVACMETPGVGARRLLAIAYPDKPTHLQKMLDETEFWVHMGSARFLKFMQSNPTFDGEWTWVSSRLRTCRVQHWSIRRQFQLAWTDLASGEFSDYWVTTKISSLPRDDFKVECPTGSGQMMTLWEVATELSERLMRIQDESGQRPVYGGTEKFQTDPNWRDLILSMSTSMVITVLASVPVIKLGGQV